MSGKQTFDSNQGIRIPRALIPGDTVGVVAASGPVAPAMLESGLQFLSEHGFQVRPGCHVEQRNAYLAGTDAQRCSDVNDMLRDPEISGVLFARGGYGSMRLLESLDYEALHDNPKILVGMSDVTALQLAVFSQCGLVSLAGPMIAGQVGRGLDPLSTEWFLRGLMEPLAGRNLFAPEFEIRVVRHGHAEGPMIGGCLSLVTALMGTEFAPDYLGTILFLEEVHEPLYRIDRMLTQLRLAGVLDTIGGIVAGYFLGPHGKSLEDEVACLLLAFTRENPVPIVSRFPHGHTLPNVTIPHGVRVNLNTDPLSLEVRDDTRP